jgi:hypothetical protein
MILLLTLVAGGLVGLLVKVAIFCVIIWAIYAILQWAGIVIPRPVQIVLIAIICIILIYGLYEIFLAL